MGLGDLNEETALRVAKYKYDEIKKRAQTCHDYQYSYHQVWITINDFTRKNTFATTKRVGGNHVFNLKKLHMDGLLHDLKTM